MRAPALYSKTPAQLGQGLAGTLWCRKCGSTERIDEEKAGRYLLDGWPTCCDETMELKTKEDLS